MNNLFNELLNSLSEEFKKYNLEESVQLSMSKLPEYDMQINNLVKYNKSGFFEELKKNIIEKINESDLFKTTEINKIGFLNLELNHEFLKNKITNSKDNFKKNNPEKIVFDYGGPNIGKPLHVGHMRTLNIGRSLYNIHLFIGNEVISDIHLGDWGMPIAQIITYLEINKINVININSSELEIIYPKASAEYQQNKKFKIRAQEINKKLNNNDKDHYNHFFSIEKSLYEKAVTDWEKNRYFERI